jgi:hypothetical protein
LDFGFLDMMKIKIVEGRDLSPEFCFEHGEQYVDEDETCCTWAPQETNKIQLSLRVGE